MPNKYSYQLTNGKTLTLEGDTMPSDEEVESVAKQQNVQLVPHDNSQQKDPVADAKSFLSNTAETKGQPTSQESASPEKQSFLSSVYHKIADPLTDAPSRFAHKVADTFEHPSLNDSELAARAKGFAGGAVEGLGNLTSGLTSPLNIILAAASGGASLAETSEAPLVAQGLRRVAQAASIPIVSQGISDVYNKPTIGEKAIGGINAVLGVGGLAEGGGLGRIAEAARDVHPEIPTSEPLPTHALPPDLVPVGEESAFNSAREKPAPVNPVDKVLDLAKNKQGMGQEIPESEISNSGPIKDKPLTADEISSRLDELKALEKNGKLTSRQAPEVKRLEGMLQDISSAKPEEAPSQSVDDIFNKPQAKSAFNFKNKERSVEDINTSRVKQEVASDKFAKNQEISQQQNPEIYPSDKAAPEVATDREANPNKPRYRLDNASGTLIPIDKSGEQIGPAIFPGKELDPALAAESKYNKGGGNEPPDKSSLLQKIYDTPRGLMSVDLPYITSAAFRQASPYVGTADWFKAWAPAAKSFGSKEAYDAINAEISNRPLFKGQGADGKLPSQAEQSGLMLTDLGKYSKREEALRGELAEKIPGWGRYVAASNRAYTAFLNSLRANRFEDLVGNLQKDGTDSLQTRQQVANAINTLTGRGKLALSSGTPSTFLAKSKVGSIINTAMTGNIEGAAKVLSNIFFSPRKIASEIQMLNPATYLMTNPVARKELLAGAFRRVATWWTVAGMAELAGAQVSHDPTNPDFGKIKLGDTRIDPPGGLQQYLVLGTQLAQGGKTSSTSGKFTAFGSKFGADTRFDDVSNFVTNRFHPTAKYIVDMAKAKKSNPFYVGDAALQLATPMYAQDLAQIAKDNPKLIPMMLGAPLSGAGIGVQSYNKSSFKNPVFLPHSMDMSIPSR